MKRLVTVLILICGTYTTTALVQQYQGYPRLVINPGTQSEIRLPLKYSITPKLTAYIDNTVSAEIEISDDGTINKISKIIRVYNSELSQNSGTFLKCL